MTTIWLTLPVVISLVTAVAIFCAKRNKALVDAISGTSALATLVIAALLTHDVINGGPQAVEFGQWLRHLALFLWRIILPLPW